MVIPHRPPILTAKMIKTIDVLSKGRITVGVGVGWMEEEMQLLNSPPFKERGPASTNTSEAFKNLWTEISPSFVGAHVKYSGLKFFPKPVKPPTPHSGLVEKHDSPDNGRENLGMDGILL